MPPAAHQPPATHPTTPGPTHPPLAHSQLLLPEPRRGKVRDVYALSPAHTSPAGDASQPRLLIIATDRISAFDVVMPTPIPGKGALLTRLAAFWLRRIEQAGICKTHLLSTDASSLVASIFPDANPAPYADRLMICKAARVVPIECVVRGYLEGSGWKEYQATGSVCGVALPAGLRQCDKLPEPIFTPATKEEGGAHDQNISFDQACALVGAPLMRRLRELSLAIYAMAARHAAARGIIVADTKFEFGLLPGSDEPILIDEVLTPDSSRFWPADAYRPGQAQPSFDKQFLREYLERLVASGQWNKQPPGPALPADVVEATRAKYAQAHERLTAP